MPTHQLLISNELNWRAQCELATVTQCVEAGTQSPVVIQSSLPWNDRRKLSKIHHLLQQAAAAMCCAKVGVVPHWGAVDDIASIWVLYALSQASTRQHKPVPSGLARWHQFA